MKPIVLAPNPVLTTPAQPVTDFGKSVKKLVEKMSETLLACTNPKGVGLAAAQIGEPYRVFITRPTEEVPVQVFINPEMVNQSDVKTDGVPERKNKLEGCLSIPKIWGKVKRAASITIRYYDQSGSVHEKNFKGFMATIIQHEIDHINGILYTQRVLEQKSKLYQATKDKEGKEVLEEIIM